MNNEWNTDLSKMPRDGTVFLAIAKNNYVIIKYSKCNSEYLGRDSFHSSDNNFFMHEIECWQYLPPPPKKNHFCKEGKLTCQSFEGKLLLHFRTSEHNIAGFPVVACPICGEKA